VLFSLTASEDEKSHPTTTHQQTDKQEQEEEPIGPEGPAFDWLHEPISCDWFQLRKQFLHKWRILSRPIVSIGLLVDMPGIFWQIVL
jgi:hypothetical protein